jgi:putative restriction endonuclease
MPQTAERRKWSRDELIAAFNLYCQLPFGQLHKTNPQIMQLARLLERTPSSVGMKLVNFASLDPVITANGRVGLIGASRLDRTIWDEFNADWETLATESQSVLNRLADEHDEVLPYDDDTDALMPEVFAEGRTRSATVQVRVNQAFFRRTVMASYLGRCCMSGLAHPRLLVASHIVPWGRDKANRLNPRNGLLLSTLHDKAFDVGLITVSADHKIMVSDTLKDKPDAFTRDVLLPLEGKPIALPGRFTPEAEFLAHHRDVIYIP